MKNKSILKIKKETNNKSLILFLVDRQYLYDYLTNSNFLSDFPNVTDTLLLLPKEQLNLVNNLKVAINEEKQTVIVTEDFFIRQLNLLIMENYYETKILNNEQGGINHKEVIAYELKLENDSEVVFEKIKVDKFGLVFKSLDVLINQINEKGEKLYYEIKYPKSKLEML